MYKFRGAEANECYYSVEEINAINAGRELSKDEPVEMLPENLLNNAIVECHSEAVVNPAIGYGYYKLPSNITTKSSFKEETFFIHIRNKNGIDMYIRNVTGEELINHNTTTDTKDLYVSRESLINVINKMSIVITRSQSKLIKIFLNCPCEYDALDGKYMIKFNYICKWFRHAEINMKSSDRPLWLLSLRMRDRYIQPILGELAWTKLFK